jgi:FkbM family methyltransferase
MNDFGKHLAAFDGVRPFTGRVPDGFLVDFMGTLTDANFAAIWGFDAAGAGGHEISTQFPDPAEGEAYCEAVGWFEAAREARGSYTMVTLGAEYGAQAVGAYLALNKVNPLPARLVAVEPNPESFGWLKQHFRDNGLDPDRHWLINCALSDSNEPVLFPVSAAGTGSNNCMSSNPRSQRAIYAEQILQSPHLSDIVRRLMVHGDTGIETTVHPDLEFKARLEFVSAITLADVLGPLDRVDLLDSDIQQSEIIVFPAAMELIADKVRRVHIGTHGGDVHVALLQDFVNHGFEIVFDLAPTTEFHTEWGSFRTQDGVITVVNPRL